MEFARTEQQNRLIGMVQAYCERHCSPQQAAQLDLQPQFPKSAYTGMAEANIFGHWLPAEYGGGGGNFTDALAICETLSRRTGTLANLFIVNSVCGALVARIGSPQQRRQLLPDITSGKLSMAFAMTEPQAGSDGSAIESDAIADAGNYVLNGTKLFTTGAQDAEYILVVARTIPGVPASRGTGLLIVRRHIAGLEVTAMDKVAGQCQASCQLTFQDVRIPLANLLGSEQQTWGALGGALEEFTQFAAQRCQFGRPIGSFQSIQHQVAELATQLEAMRWLAYRAAWMADNRIECRKEISMAKSFCVDTGMQIATQTMRLVGGIGFLRTSSFNRRWREAALGFYAGGTREVQLNNIARFMNLPN
jgi:alkylation response protein AidB-like acyl-CoA dehydrogenase